MTDFEHEHLPQPPTDVSDSEALSLWWDILESVDSEGNELDESSMTLLRQLVRHIQLVARMQATLNDEELITPGYLGKGQRPNPLIQSIDRGRMTIANLIKQLSGGPNWAEYGSRGGKSRWNRG